MGGSAAVNRDGRAIHRNKVAAAVILTTLIGTHNRCLVEAPGKGLAHDVRGIR